MKKYKYTWHINGKEEIATLKKKGEFCYLYHTEEYYLEDMYHSYFPIEKYDNFNFYYILEPLIKDLGDFKPTTNQFTNLFKDNE